jgi:alpha-beta hydrolase superfamily lysophospholipase
LFSDELKEVLDKNDILNGYVVPLLASKDKNTHFAKAVQDMRHAGYLDVKGKLYPGMRHEILNETDKKRVYHDIAFYIRKKGF